MYLGENSDQEKIESLVGDKRAIWSNIFKYNNFEQIINTKKPTYMYIAKV